MYSFMILKEARDIVSLMRLNLQTADFESKQIFFLDPAAFQVQILSHKTLECFAA